jgi:hypothetical protein
VHSFPYSSFFLSSYLALNDKTKVTNSSQVIVGYPNKKNGSRSVTVTDAEECYLISDAVSMTDHNLSLDSRIYCGYYEYNKKFEIKLE